jgi:hypothetical protein
LSAFAIKVRTKCEYDQRAFKKMQHGYKKTAEFDDYFEFVETVVQNSYEKVINTKIQKKRFFKNFNTVCKGFGPITLLGALFCTQRRILRFTV